MVKIHRSKYRDYIAYAERCTADRVYPMSIVTGAQSGEIYTDGTECVLFWHYCGFAYISGIPGPDLLEEIYREFLTADTGRRFLLITDLESVSDHYADRDPLQLDKRIEYFHSGMPEDPPALDDHFMIEPITADNTEDIRGLITPSFSWESSCAFLQNGFGFLARSRKDSRFAAAAFSSAVSPEEVDIGVETSEVFRYNGLASYLAYRMCEEIILQGKKPVWAHAEANAGSRKTAIRTGFVPCRVNTVIRRKR